MKVRKEPRAAPTLECRDGARGPRRSQTPLIVQVDGPFQLRIVKTYAPRLSACVMMVRPVVFASRAMAFAIFLDERSVTAAIVDPLPLRNAPSAPAFSAAATTRGRKGISFARYGW